MNGNKVEKSDLIGEIEGFPIDIVQAMIGEQIRQGNKPNVKLFQYYKYCCCFCGGFDWDASILGSNIWADILFYGNWEMFYKNKNKLDSTIENKGIIKTKSKFSSKEVLDKIVKECNSKNTIKKELELLTTKTFRCCTSNTECVSLQDANKTIQNTLNILKEEAIGLVCPILANCEVAPEDVIYLQEEMNKHLSQLLKEIKR